MIYTEEHMSYEDARGCLLRAEQTRGIRPGLFRMRQLMGLLGEPEKSVRGIIHVAGTNGKGSILAFLDEILRRSGYRVTKYTSPAVFAYLERYTVDGQPVSEEWFAGAAERVICAAEFMAKEDGDPPTAFEMETAIAYLIASEAEGDFFLVETGMGGTLDATNIEERALLSVIASVSMDHMAFLGDTLEEIAAQKAGIIKDGCPVVVSASNFRGKTEKTDPFPSLREGTHGKMPEEPATGATVPGEPTSQNVTSEEMTDEFPGAAVMPIREIAAAHHAPLYRGDDCVPYRLSLPGTYQQENAGTVMAAIRVLRRRGYRIPEACVRDGFENTIWPGRFEIVKREPLCILDGAHNADAARRLAETLREPCYSGKRKFLVMGIFQDKEYDKVVGALVPMAEEVYVISPDPPRGLPAEMLAACVKKHTGRPVYVCENVRAAVRGACRAAGENGPESMVLCCGSLSYLGEAKKILLGESLGS